MVRDITYCYCDDCPFTDCLRHRRQLAGERETVIISMANFGSVCQKYIESVVGETQDGGLQFQDGLYMTEEG